MKPNIIQKLAVVLCALMFSVGLNATESNALFASDVAIEKGTTEFILPIYLNNSVSITGVQFDLNLPKGMEVAYTTNRNGNKSYTNTIIKGEDRFLQDTDHSISCMLQSNGAMRIILSSITNKPLIDNDSQGNDIRTTSPLLNIKITLSNDISGGSYPIGIKNVVLSSYVNNITTKYEAENSTSYLTIKKHLVQFIIDGEIVKSDILEYGSPVIAPEIPEKVGYTVAGWEPALETTVPDHDVIYTAQYKINQYTITFDTDGGSDVSPITQDYGSAITKPADPTKAGYTLAGWNPAIPEVMPAENMTIKATWTINSYKLTYKVDGDIYKEYTLEYQSSITPEAKPTKEGYTFSGWSEIPSAMPAHDVEVNGSFIVNIYQVSYFVENKMVHQDEVAFGDTFDLWIYEPDEDDLIFNGWIGEVYATMPAHDISYIADISCDMANICNSPAFVEDIYTLDGKKVQNPHGGMYLVRFNDGTVKKLHFK